MNAIPDAVEAPSGKNAEYENFPVGSWLLPPETRPHVAVFYAFARAIDDIADHPDLSPETKIERLTGFEDVLLGRGAREGYAKAERMRLCLAETGTTPRHCLDLITAFKQDAVKGRYRDWEDLMDYCRLSAAPVGRYLLDLHGGSRDGYVSSDALCMALQVINHLQDCADDYRTLDRVYLPGDWMAEQGCAVESLSATASTPNLRRVIDRAVVATRELMIEAHQLPGMLRSRRLAMESAGIVKIADSLLARLAREDPLGSRIVLPKWKYAADCLGGGISALFGRGGR